jgi:aldose 1-epimerase
LTDASAGAAVTVVPAFGMNAIAMEVKGQPVLWNNRQSPAALMAKPGFVGNPFLWPWANRIDGEAYFANGKRYVLNRELGNYRTDGNKQPIHGLVAYSKDWEVAEARGGVLAARLKFSEFPALMAQFPFAHTVTMRYRLRGAALEVETMVENHAREALPLSLGYHPYFQIADAPRDEWTVTLPAKERVTLGQTLVPTGERTPNEQGRQFALKGVTLDDVFTSLERDADGWARFRVKGRRQEVVVEYGPEFPVAVVFAPPGRGFICFEPMTGVTNAFNEAQRGRYAELQKVAPGGTWRGVFRIRAEGY